MSLASSASVSNTSISLVHHLVYSLNICRSLSQRPGWRRQIQHPNKGQCRKHLELYSMNHLILAGPLPPYCPSPLRGFNLPESQHLRRHIGTTPCGILSEAFPATSEVTEDMTSVLTATTASARLANISFTQCYLVQRPTRTVRFGRFL